MTMSASINTSHQDAQEPSLCAGGSHEAPVCRCLLRRLLVCLQSLIPEGYQDREGFHYGIKPARGMVHYPAFW
jgi:hypothetical protein